DFSSHLLVGAHVGFYPIPELEIGYGFQAFKATPQNSDTGDNLSDVNAFLQSADLSYVREFEPIKGAVNFHAQWVWSRIGSFVDSLNADNAAAGNAIPAAAPFNNNRNGGYVQLAYRPTKLENPILKNFEGI